MMQLCAVHVVQFFQFESETLPISEVTGVFGPNGSGKSSFIDAIQIAMFGAQSNHVALNAQADDKRSTRSIRSYCLGQYGEGPDQRARDVATTYISLIWRDEETRSVTTTGVCLYASGDSEDHEILGLYVVPGIELSLSDHLSKGDDGTRPRDWKTFRADLLRRAKSASEDEILYKTSRQYVRALLARLRSDNGVPEHDAFLRAFRFGLRMKFDKRVDEIVRNEVLEARATNVKRFREVTESFRSLTQMVERISEQIDVGKKIVTQFDRAHEQALRGASWRILARDVEAERLRDIANHAKIKANEAWERHEHTKEKLSRTTTELESARSERDRARQLRDAHSSNADFSYLQTELERRNDEARKHTATLSGTLKEIGIVLRNVSPSAYLKAFAEELQQQHSALSALATSDLVGSDIESVVAALKGAIALGKRVLEALVDAGRTLHVQRQLLEEEQRQVTANLQRVAEGKAPLSDSVTNLAMALRDQGIDAVPVCDVVRVTDAKWQPAIEGYLGLSNMEALVVDSDKEREAFKVYRGIVGRGTIYGVKIVMPSRIATGKTPSAGSVAEFIAGEQPVAVAYVRQLLGELKRAQSDDEALRVARTLTADGMLVSGSTMERLRLQGQLRLGIREDQHKAELHLALRTCQENLTRVTQAQELLERHTKLLYVFESESKLVDEIRGVFAQAQSARRHGEAHAVRLRGLADGEYQELCATLQSLEEAATEVEGRHAQLASSLSGLERDASHAQSMWEVEERSAQDAHDRLAVERKDTPHDVAFADEEWDKLLRAYPGSDYGQMKAHCDARASATEVQQKLASGRGLSALTEYLAKYNERPDENTLSDWMLAREWISGRVQHLNETDLVSKREQMETAYQTSQETFRTDVAIALNNNLLWLEDTLAKLNSVLATCPTFSNGERYRFKRTLRADHKALHKFVQDVAAFGVDDDLAGAGELPREFRALLEERSISGPGSVRSPLDDYREFFDFEIEILRSDAVTGKPKVVGNLSARIGHGSGGEHRAPLYVIAGAALASAYRLRPQQKDGIRLMLLDEAFNKMDPNNITATMRYLEELGLQVFLASPGEHQGTLSAFLHRYYDIVRDPENNVVSLSGHDVSEATRELMRSDLIEYHPELLDEEILRLSSPAPEPDVVE